MYMKTRCLTIISHNSFCSVGFSCMPLDDLSYSFCICLQAVRNDRSLFLLRTTDRLVRHGNEGKEERLPPGVLRLLQVPASVNWRFSCALFRYVLVALGNVNGILGVNSTEKFFPIPLESKTSPVVSRTPADDQSIRNSVRTPTTMAGYSF